MKKYNPQYAPWALKCDYERKAKGLTWDEVAAAIGYTRAYVSNVVCSRIKSEQCKNTLCAYFDVPQV